MLHKQDAARGFASSFAPKTRFGIFLRNQITKAFALPYVAKLAIGSSLLDTIALPDYYPGFRRDPQRARGQGEL